MSHFFSESLDKKLFFLSRMIRLWVLIGAVSGIIIFPMTSEAQSSSHSSHLTHQTTSKNSKKRTQSLKHKSSQSKHASKKGVKFKKKKEIHKHTHAISHTAKAPAVAPLAKVSANSAQPTLSPPTESDKGTVTGLPLPRFLALRADEVNMRTGPGIRYPILWVYHRRNLPMKVEREFDVWRLVEDVDGQKGWVQQATLVSNRTFIVKGEPLSTSDTPADISADKKRLERTDNRIVSYLSDVGQIEAGKKTVILRQQANISSTPVAILYPGVIGIIHQCPSGSDWCKVSVKQYSGWLQRDSFWGVMAQEVISSP